MLFVLDSTDPTPDPQWQISGANLLAGMASSAFAAQLPYFDFVAGAVNDGTLLTAGNVVATRASRTFDGNAGNNNGHGIEVDFGSGNPKRIGRLRLSCYGADVGAVCDLQPQYYNLGWVNAGAAVANITASYTLRDINCNADHSVTAERWRVIVTNWVTNANNFYTGELQAFEWVFI